MFLRSFFFQLFSRCYNASIIISTTFQIFQRFSHYSKLSPILPQLLPYASNTSLLCWTLLQLITSFSVAMTFRDIERSSTSSTFYWRRHGRVDSALFLVARRLLALLESLVRIPHNSFVSFFFFFSHIEALYLLFFECWSYNAVFNHFELCESFSSFVKCLSLDS